MMEDARRTRFLAVAADDAADLCRKLDDVLTLPVAERRIVLVPAGTATAAMLPMLGALAAAGYRVGARAGDESALHLLQNGEEDFPRSDYAAFAAGLPRALQDAVWRAWGPPERDPFFRAGALDCGSFALNAARFGNIAVALPPAPGRPIDPQSADENEPPPHAQLAFAAWISDGLRADAAVTILPSG